MAVFGGSFDPPHVGHVLAVTYVLSVYPIDGVLVVPVFQHAFGKELASFDDRLAMCRLAMAPIDHVEVSDVERELGGESRTLYTIEALLARRPEWDLKLVIGSDVLPDLPKWHRFDRIAELAPPIVIGRAGYPHPDAPLSVLPEVSSSAIRASLGAGEASAVRPMLPTTVAEYISERHLYRTRG